MWEFTTQIRDKSPLRFFLEVIYFLSTLDSVRFFVEWPKKTLNEVGDKMFYIVKGTVALREKEQA